MDILCFVPLFFCVFLPGFCQNISQRTVNEHKLFTDLFASYWRNTIPVDQTTGNVKVSLALTINSLIQLDEIKETLDINAWLSYEWKDASLVWDSSAYGDVAVIRVPVSKIWIPDISLYNGVSEIYKFNAENAVLYHTGEISWIPSVRLQGVCFVNLVKFPFDVQTCKLKFGSWVHSGDTLDIDYRNGDPKLALDIDMDESGKDWTLVNASVKRNVKYYSCCPEPYPSMDYTIVLKRNPVYYVHTYVLPAILLSILVPFQLILPPESSERLTLGIGLILSNLLMILRLQDVLPTAHVTLPAIGMFYSLNFTWSVLAVITTIFVLNIHNRGPRQGKVPNIIRLLFLRSLKRIVCLGDDTYYPFDSTDSVSMRGLENPCMPSSPGDDYKDRQAKNGSSVERDVEQIAKQVHVLASRSNIRESRHGIKNEWFQVALVADRVMFFFFILTFLIYIVVLMA